MTDPGAPQSTRSAETALARGRGVAATRLRVIVVEQEVPLRRALARILAQGGFDVRTCEDAAEAAASIEGEAVDVVVLDVGAGGIEGGLEGGIKGEDGLGLFARLRALRPDAEFVVTVAADEVETALSAVRAGAYGFVTKPFASASVVSAVVEKAAERRMLLDRARRLEETIRAEEPAADFVGASAAMQEIRRVVASLSQSPSTVLVHGESGTGKEFLARALHRQGPRATRPFVPVHCAAIPDAAIDGELFGWLRGAFPGATSSRTGLLEAADGGTVYLAEVGRIPLATQAKLLRVLQEGEVRRLGSNDVRRIDVRIVAATSVDLRELVGAGKFREDLFYRLQVVKVAVPPLRERQDDVPVLATLFLRKYATRLGREVRRLSVEAVTELQHRPWPGNVRELENVIERAVAVAASDAVRVEDLPAPEPTAGGEGVSRLPDLTLLSFREAKAVAIRSFERDYVTALLRRTSGNVTQAARRAELDRSNFRRLVRKTERGV